jgi:hypothetical protein
MEVNIGILAKLKFVACQTEMPTATYTTLRSVPNASRKRHGREAASSMRRM